MFPSLALLSLPTAMVSKPHCRATAALMQATSAIQAWPQGTRLLSLLCSHLHQVGPPVSGFRARWRCETGRGQGRMKAAATQLLDTPVCQASLAWQLNGPG